MKKFVVILSAALLGACSIVGASNASVTAGASSEATADFVYGRHAGQPMRDAPDSY